MDADASRSRRFARLRITAFPTLRLAVNPTRMIRLQPNSAGRGAACKTKPGVIAFWRAEATRRKSARRLSVTSPRPVEIRAVDGKWDGIRRLRRIGVCGPSPAARPAPCGRPQSPSARGSRVGACGRGCWAGKCASRHRLRLRDLSQTKAAIYEGREGKSTVPGRMPPVGVRATVPQAPCGGFLTGRMAAHAG
jgi:hypothetical protein